MKNSGKICLISDNDNLSLYSKNFRIDFKTGNSFSVQNIAGFKNSQWINKPGGFDNLWYVYLIGPDKTAPCYMTSHGKFLGYKIITDTDTAKEIEFSWSLRVSVSANAIIKVNLKADADSPVLLWGISAELPSGWQIDKLDFPVIEPIKYKKDLKLAAPSGYGLEYDVVPGFTFEGVYPSYGATMQVSALFDKSSCIYYAAHDPDACLKEFRLECKKGNARLFIRHPLPLNGENKESFRLPYPVAMGFIKGNYIEAAKIYREFALTTKWGNSPKNSKRNIPDWLRNTDIWLRPDGDAEKNVEITKKALKYLNASVSLHWYRWHQIEYDTHYPEYLPAIDGIKEGIAELQKYCNGIMIYINGRLWDPNSNSWKNDNAAASAVRLQDGKCCTEVYGSLISNNAMCPSTPLWQNKINDVAHSIFDTLGVNGVYIDQIGCAKGIPCYAENHPHLPGGGDFWHYGYRKMLDKIRAGLKPGKIITTEENAECWLDQFEALLTLNTPEDGRIIPFYPAVYSDRTILIATQYYSKSEPANQISFRLKNARALLWGAQLGWIQSFRLMEDGVESTLEFMKNIAHLRRHTRKYFLDGEFMGMIEIGGDNNEFRLDYSGAFGGSLSSLITPVMASLWNLEGTAKAVFAVNISDEARKVKLTDTTKFLSKGKSSDYTIKVYTKEGFSHELPCGKSVEFEIAPRNGIMLEFIKK